MFRVLDPCLSLPPHGLPGRAVYQCALAHLLQPLLTQKAEASRLSLAEHYPCCLPGSLPHPGGWRWGVGILTPTTPWVHRSLSPLSSLVAKLPGTPGFITQIGYIA